MKLDQLKGKSQLIDALIVIAEQYFMQGTTRFGNVHDDWCRSIDGGFCHCHRGRYFTDLFTAVMAEPGLTMYSARAPFDIKAGEFFVLNTATSEVLLESNPSAKTPSEFRKQNPGLSDAELATQYAVDAVNHPSHYNAGKIEVIEFIEDQRLTYHLGNTVKYIARAGRKDPTKELEDLEKAAWYLKRRIETLKAEREGRAVVRPNDMGRPPALPVSGPGVVTKGMG